MAPTSTTPEHADHDHQVAPADQLAHVAEHAHRRVYGTTVAFQPGRPASGGRPPLPPGSVMQFVPHIVAEVVVALHLTGRHAAADDLADWLDDACKAADRPVPPAG